MWNITTRNLNEFKDIFESRRTETSNFMYMSRNLDNVVSPFNQLTKLTPTQLKYEVLKSRTITNLIDTVIITLLYRKSQSCTRYYLV